MESRIVDTTPFNPVLKGRPVVTQRGPTRARKLDNETMQVPNKMALFEDLLIRSPNDILLSRIEDELVVYDDDRDKVIWTSEQEMFEDMGQKTDYARGVLKGADISKQY